MLLLKRKIDVNGVPYDYANPLFSGSIVALVTPMDNHGNIDFETLEKLIEFSYQCGYRFDCICGDNRESPPH
ncbi:MAG: dihydrodipicolinate synthase family protein [Haemophilus parainfluenzae]